MNKNIIIGVLVAIVIIVGGYAIWKTVSTPAPVVQVVDSQNPTLNQIPQTAPAQNNTPVVPTPDAGGTIAVNGMTKYTDTNLGYSFWYPSNWTVTTVSSGGISALSGGSVTQTLDIGSANDSTDGVIVQDFVSTGKTITDSSNCGPADACPPSVHYYFNPTTHLWMKESYPYDTTLPQGSYPADISVNTMGGLHIFAGNAREGDDIVPLSASHFVVVSVINGSTITRPLTKTIVAADPAVAVPVSAAQQVQTIQAELTAYVPAANQQSTAPSWQTYTDPATGITIQYASLNGVSMQPNIQITPSTGVDANGCVPTGIGSDSIIAINGIRFCKSIEDDSGAGHLGSGYDYTFFKNGTYYTISYDASGLDCGAYGDSTDPQYQSCESRNGSINSLVQYIEQSLATLSF
jgi:hypothetical protein